MASVHRVGGHTCSMEDPDIMAMTLVGRVSAAEGSEINRIHLEMGQSLDRLFYLINMKDFEGMDPAVRKEAGLVMTRLPLRGIAVYQASLTARVIAKLIVGAMNVFKHSSDKAPFEAFATEEDARAWIALRRRQLLEAAA